MLYLVTGGAGSGKSAFAEGLITASPYATRVYLATMQGGDGESERRIARHRAMRAGKGFATLERPRDLAGAPVPEGSAVLLEDLSNLTANEYFSPLGPAGAGERVLAGWPTCVSAPPWWWWWPTSCTLTGLPTAGTPPPTSPALPAWPGLSPPGRTGCTRWYAA